MLIASIGQLATPSNAAEIRDQLLRDLNLAGLDAGLEDPPVQPGSDWFLLSTAVGNLCLIGFANQSIGLDAQNILTSTGTELDSIRAGLGIAEVAASGSTGKIKIKVFGSTTLVNGTEFVLPNGLRGRVVGTFINPADGDEVDVESIDTGTNTNLAGNEVVRFVSPPSNIGTDATVSIGQPLTGGTDSESDDRKRARILDTLRNKPAGGNWSHVREMALEALGSVVDCYVFPAPGGPGSAKIVPVKDFDPERNDYSRQLSAAAAQTVRAAIQSQMPTPMELVIESAADQSVDFSLLVTIPESSLNGGNGKGWTDYPVWPELEVSDGGRTPITSINSSNDVVTLNADTTTAPIDGITHVAWWSTVDKKFYTALVVDHAGSSGAWVISLDRALSASDGTGPAAGDYICPAAENLDEYGKAWVNLFRALGTGELTADTNRVPRALRHPFATDEDPYDLNAGTIARWSKQFAEISDYEVGYSSATAPTVPSAVSDPVNILIPGKFGVYKQ